MKAFLKVESNSILESKKQKLNEISTNLLKYSNKNWGEIGDQIFKITPILTKLHTKRKSSKALISLAYNTIQHI